MSLYFCLLVLSNFADVDIQMTEYHIDTTGTEPHTKETVSTPLRKIRRNENGTQG